MPGCERLNGFWPDMRSIVPFDEDLIFQSVRKTNRVIVAWEDSLTMGVGAESGADCTALNRRTASACRRKRRGISGHRSDRAAARPAGQGGQTGHAFRNLDP